MTRPAHSTILDSIIASGSVERAWRILSCEAEWPDGEPPFGVGERVTVSDLPDLPPLYDPVATWDPYAWADVTHLVSDYSIQQDAALQSDEFSLTIPEGWSSTDLARVFREMRIVRIQCRYWGASLDTGWFDQFFGFCDGFRESWDRIHHYEIRGKCALKLAGLEVLGAQTGNAVYQPDKVTYGTLGTHYTLTLVNTASDAWEYGITSAVVGGNALHPNWADSPLPQFWCHNVPNESEPIPLAMGGNAVQAVFGEGIIRLGKIWAQTSPGSPPDYSLGLGFVDPAVPDVRAVLARFAHPTLEEPEGYHSPPLVLPSDIADDLTAVASVPGYARVTGNLTQPQALTLMADDGTGREWATESYALDGPETLFNLVNGTAEVAAGTSLRYGNANRARDVILRMLLDCGYQTNDDTEPLYIHPPEIPEMLGEANDIILPPMTYARTEGRTALDAIEDMRREGYIPPAYIVHSLADGSIAVETVGILDAEDIEENEEIIPVVAIAAPVEIDRSDLMAVTRVVARGQRRQVVDYAMSSTVADVPDYDGGLPDYFASAYGWGQSKRSAPGANDYLFTLSWILEDRAIPAETLPIFGIRGGQVIIIGYSTFPIVSHTVMRPWAWHYHPENVVFTDARREQWRGKALCDITFAASSLVDRVELNVSSGWFRAFELGTPVGQQEAAYWNDTSNFYTRTPLSASRPARALPQVLSIKYWSSEQAGWRPLVSHIPAHAQFPEVIRVSSADFDTRAPTETTKIRIVCEEPFLFEAGTHNNPWYYATIGVYLSRVRVWSSPELWGIAELGNAANWNDELVDEPWPAIRKRLRTRTYVMPSTAPWGNTQDEVNWLALQWLKEKTADLAPRQFNALRPDVRLWDTVRATFPDGATTDYLVTRIRHGAGPTAALAGTNYAAPAFGGDE